MTLPLPKENTKSDNYGWSAGPGEITSREINETLIGLEVAREISVWDVCDRSTPIQ